MGGRRVAPPGFTSSRRQYRCHTRPYRVLCHAVFQVSLGPEKGPRLNNQAKEHAAALRE